MFGKKKFSSSKQTLWRNSWTILDKPHLEVNIVYAWSVGEIFPPYTLYTRTRGRPFWGGYACSRAASQISECFWRMLLLTQNITCYLCRNLFEKIFVRRYTVWEIFVIILEKKLFSHTMGRWFEEEMYYVASSKSYFLEWGYWLVGGIFQNYDGDNFKAYFVCFSY